MSEQKLIKRIENLEERAAFQEVAIDELSETINDQWKLIEALKRDIERVGDELKEVEHNMSGDQREPPPPHY